MGKASREKWERRFQALLANRSPKTYPRLPWYESTTAQWLVGLGFAIVLTVVAAIMPDLRWLLLPAWLCFSLAFVPISANIISLRRRVSGIFAGILVSGVCLYMLDTALKPRAISDQQLCAQAKAHAQRMRDFDRERKLQQRETEQRYEALIDEAKTDEEKTRIRKKKSEAFTQWFDKWNYDYTNYLMPQAKYFRYQILLRLPPQPRSVLAPDEAVFLNIGANSIYQAADRLEVWAKTLCPKP